MARVFIDAHMFSEGWFKDILQELIGCQNVEFVYANVTKLNAEMSKVRQALEFLKIAGVLKKPDKSPRRIEASPIEVEKQQTLLESMKCFTKCADCDDPHIFALIYVKPTPYVFSKDARMARCRDEINKTVESRYCKFIVISTAQTYAAHRHSVLS